MIAYKKSDFNILEKIGEGAYGKVYKVSLKKNNEEFALKVLSKNQIEKLNFFPQLKKEIQILSNCNHKNIIKLISVFDEKNEIFLLTELAKEGSLYKKLKQVKYFTEEIVLNYMLQIIKGIQYLQNQNPPVIHRDIKPENILIKDGILKICDFGWSNYDDTLRNTLCGTPDYNSPEVILGTGHSEKLDVWALGVLMYELLHGRPPFSPIYHIKDVRVLQKTIENNILNGKLVFDKNISVSAKNAILTMLNPKKDLRPLARDLLNIEFFKCKVVKINEGIQQKRNSGFKINEGIQQKTNTGLNVKIKKEIIHKKNTGLNVKIKKEIIHKKNSGVVQKDFKKKKNSNPKVQEDLKKKYFDLEFNYRKEIEKNSNLTKNLKDKDLLLNMKNEEINNLKNYKKDNDNDISKNLKDKIKIMSQSVKEKDFLLNSKIEEINYLKNTLEKTNSSYKKILLENKKILSDKKIQLNPKNEKIEEDLKKLNIKLIQKEETITYLYAMTKKLTNTINEFYNKNFDLKKEEKNNNGISFNNIINKLSDIFSLISKEKNNNNFIKEKDFENIPILKKNKSINIPSKNGSIFSQNINFKKLSSGKSIERRNNIKRNKSLRSKSKTFFSTRFIHNNHFK